MSQDEVKFFTWGFANEVFTYFGIGEIFTWGFANEVFTYFEIGEIFYLGIC